MIATGVVAFASSDARVLLALLGLQVVLWFGARLGAHRLWGSVRRLLVFVTFIVLSYAFFENGEQDRFVRWSFLGLGLRLNLTALAEGLLRSSRLVTVVLCSQIIQRTGSPEDLMEGLRGFGAPRFLARGLDLVLRALGPREEGRGRGRRRAEKGPDDRFDFKALLKGDVGVVADLAGGYLARARRSLVESGLPAGEAADLAVVVGLTVLAMTLRFLRLMPGLPIAPGHKGIILIPIYVLAVMLTRSRWGATRYGLLMGVTSFLMGMGKFGPFDILRHVTPGLFADLTVPVALRLVSKPGPVVYGLIGIGIAATRLSTIVAVALVVEVPATFFALLVPTTMAHLVFGMLSGLVTFPLLGGVEKLRAAVHGTGDELSEEATATEKDAPSVESAPRRED